MEQKNYVYEEQKQMEKRTAKSIFDQIVQWVREDFIARSTRENDTSLRICFVDGEQFVLELKEK